MNDLYEYILNALRDLSGTQNDEAQFRAYLISLQEVVRRLRRSFRQPCVTVDYSSEEIQAAYLVAYYPNYVEMTREVLERIELQHFDFQRKELRVCLFGAGPAPEIVGLMSFLRSRFPIVDTLEIYIFDIADRTWKISRDLARNHIISHLWERENFYLSSVDFDICKPKSFQEIEKIIQSSQLFIFQNCLNELISRDTVTENLRYLLQAMPARSNIVIADLDFNATTNTLSRINRIVGDLNAISRETSNQESFLIRSSESIINYRSQLRISRLITSHILIGSLRDPDENIRLLTPKRGVNFHFLSVYKSGYTVDIQPALPTHQDLELLGSLKEQIEGLLQRISIVESHVHLLESLKEQVSQINSHLTVVSEATIMEALQKSELADSELARNITQVQSNLKDLNEIIEKFYQLQIEILENNRSQTIERSYKEIQSILELSQSLDIKIEDLKKKTSIMEVYTHSLELVKDQVSHLSDQFSSQTEIARQTESNVTKILRQLNQFDTSLKLEISRVLEEFTQIQMRIKGLDEKIIHSQQALWKMFRDRSAQSENYVVEAVLKEITPISTSVEDLKSQSQVLEKILLHSEELTLLKEQINQIYDRSSQWNNLILESESRTIQSLEQKNSDRANEKEQVLSNLILQENHSLKRRLYGMRFLLVGIIGIQLITFLMVIYILIR